jgi:para-nitrobenzyl esterase
MYGVVETRSGKLRGGLSDGVAAFEGVPYAAPPFGANRLRPPQPVEPEGGPRSDDDVVRGALPPLPETNSKA